LKLSERTHPHVPIVLSFVVQFLAPIDDALRLERCPYFMRKIISYLSNKCEITVLFLANQSKQVGSGYTTAEGSERRVATVYKVASLIIIKHKRKQHLL